jgi:hypothetical protein
VEVEKPPGGRAARVDLELPDTVLRGRVVDADGRPQPGASLLAVDLRQGRRELMELADSEGAFELRGLEPGPLSIQAQSAAGVSPWVAVNVLEGGEPSEIVLRIGRSRRITGRVVSAAGPVADATVKIVPAFTGEGPVAPVTTVTKVDGSFELDLPEHVRHGAVLVFPPGFAATVFHRSFGEETGRLDVGVESGGGTLDLALAPVREGARASGLLLHGGTVVGVEQFEEWSRLHGGELPASGRLRIPALQSGTYRLCSRSLLAPDGDRSATPCDEGFLPSGGLLELGIQAGQSGQTEEEVK